jgi:hypothetical protein
MSGQTDQRGIRELIERERVAALVNHYVATLDGPTDFGDDWARSLFTEDARLEHRIAVLEGIKEIAAAHHVLMTRWERTLHFSTNHHVELDGDSAHLTARLIAIHIHPDENPPDALIAANILDADVIHMSTRWRFQRLALRNLWRTGESPEEFEANKR